MLKYFLGWSWRRNLHVPVLISLEIITVLLYAFYVRFDSPLSQERWNTLNPLFNDVHVMVFLGIAFILTFVNNYGLTSICFNFLIGSMSVQWYILGNFPTPHHTTLKMMICLLLVTGFIHSWYEGGEGETVIKVTMASFLYGEYAAATVLVTFCMMLGKVSILQLIIMALLEVRRRTGLVIL